VDGKRMEMNTHLGPTNVPYDISRFACANVSHDGTIRTQSLGEEHLYSLAVADVGMDISWRESIMLRRYQWWGATLSWAVFFCVAAVLNSAEARVYTLQKGSNRSIIVFIHGLWGDPITSFKSDGASSSWPQLMIADTRKVLGATSPSQYGYVVLGYPAGTDGKLSPVDVAKRLKDDLESNTDFNLSRDYDEILFVAHSLGGLIAQQIILDWRRDRPDLYGKIGALAMLSTPTQGAPAADFIKSLGKVIPELGGRLIVDLASLEDNSFLVRLGDDWRGRQGPKVTLWFFAPTRKNQSRRDHCRCWWYQKRLLLANVMEVAEVRCRSRKIIYRLSSLAALSMIFMIG
jgi:pimeloyl-ACP methyl ester carboxylesterase